MQSDESRILERLQRIRSTSDSLTRAIGELKTLLTTEAANRCTEEWQKSGCEWSRMLLYYGAALYALTKSYICWFNAERPPEAWDEARAARAVDALQSVADATLDDPYRANLKARLAALRTSLPKWLRDGDGDDGDGRDEALEAELDCAIA